MKCAVDRNTTDPIDIAPLGCKPVSLDRCESGYMAAKENVTLPGGEQAPMDQCCQCKPGETCGYCENETMCTDEEKRRYVAEEEECFDVPPPPTEEEEESSGPSGPAPEYDEDVPLTGLAWWKKNLWVIFLIGFIIVLSLLGLWTRLPTYSRLRKNIPIMIGVVILLDVFAILLIKYLK
jgi:hypothetical protein